MKIIWKDSRVYKAMFSSAFQEAPAMNPQGQRFDTHVDHRVQWDRPEKTMNTWADLKFWKSQRWKDIQSYLALRSVTYPAKKDIFNALKYTRLKDVKAVIIGQDPYYTGEADGLAFSCNKPMKDCPPSLQNIMKEYAKDIGWPVPETGNLLPWARHGVLLLNTHWTTEPGKPLAHAKIGWDDLTTEIIQVVRRKNPSAVFILWGREAQNLAIPLIGDSPRVESVHPSPRSAPNGFFGSKPFTKANAELQRLGHQGIRWFLEFRAHRIQN